MNRLRSLIPVLLIVPLAAAVAGGWAVLTVQELPEYLVAGKPTTVQFAVRQHGKQLLDGLNATIEARNGSKVVQAPARPAGAKGHYAASVTLPEPGEWTISIESGFGRASDLTLMPVSVIAAGAKAPAALSGVDLGKRLFVAKGCVTCHVQNKIGPDLAGRTFERKYLRAFLADPSIRPQTQPVEMPNLGLSATEIAALTEYLSVTSPVQASR